MWPTPTAEDYRRRGPNSRQQGLPEAVHERTYPTPRASGQEKPDSLIRRKGLKAAATHNLTAAALLYPTVTSREHKGPRSPEALAKAGRSNRNTLSDYIRSQTPGQLNPRWVEWLQGYPLDATELSAWATAWFLQQRGKRSNGS